MFKNKLSSSMYQEQSTPLRSLRWVLMFPLTFLAIPIMFVLMSIFTQFIEKVFDGVYQESFVNSNVYANLTTNNITYLNGTSSDTSDFQCLVTQLTNLKKRILILTIVQLHQWLMI